MTLAQFKCFLIVAEKQSFSHAASILYVSQPAVSKQISALEAELGFALFDRSGKSLCLTEAGELFLDFILNCQKNLDSTMSRIKRRQNTVFSGTVNIGCIVTWSSLQFFTRISEHFSVKYPNVRLTLEGYGMKEIPSALRENKIDIGFTYEFAAQKQSDMVSKSLVELSCGLLYAPRYFPSLGEHPSLRDFRNEFFLINEMEGENLMGKFVSGICGADGFYPRLKCTRGSLSSNMDVSCGNGVMLVDEWSIFRDNPSLNYIPVSGKIPVNVIYSSAGSIPLKELFVDEVMGLFTSENWTDALS